MNETGSSKKQKRGQDDEKNGQEQRRRQIQFTISYLITSLIAFWLFQQFFLIPRSTEIAYNEFKKKLVDAQIVQVTIGGRSIVGEMKNPKPDGTPPAVPFNTVPAPAGDPKLIEELQNANVTYRFERPPGLLAGILSNLLPFLLLAGFWYTVYRRAGAAAGGGLGGIFGVGKSKATEVKPEEDRRHLQGCRRRRRGHRRAAGDHPVSEDAREIRPAGRAHPQGRAAGRPSGHRQDPAGQGHRRRSQVAFLRNQRLRVCGDVCGRGRGPRPRPVRAGPQGRSGDHLHRRD